MNTLSNLSPGDGALTISQLAERTGVSAPTLRAWESRHDFPTPRRQPGRHRRYDAATVADVRRVLTLREEGLTLEAAIGQVRHDTSPVPDATVFSGVRRRHPDLPVHTLTKDTLLALTRAMEDECCARAVRPVLYAGFQRAEFLDRSRDRWEDLARTAAAAVAFAEPAEDVERPPRRPGSRLVVADLPADAPLCREWSLVCASREHPASLAAWEIPGQTGVRDADRLYEAVWSLDARVTHDAAAIAHALLVDLAPGGAADVPRPEEHAPATGSSDLARASSVFARTLARVDARRR